MTESYKPQSQDMQVTIDGQTFTLRFGIRALLALKDRWQIETDAGLLARVDKGQLDDMVTIVWAAALSHHRDLTRDDILERLDNDGLSNLPGMIKSLVSASVPNNYSPPKVEGE